MKNLLKLLLQGILYVAPAALTIFILTKIFFFLDSILETIVGKDIPGFGLITLFGGLILIGFLGNTFISDPLKKSFNKWLDKVPLIKVIYSSVKDLLGAFVGNKKKFNNPVMVKEHSNSSCYKVGFITQESVASIGIERDLVAVYFPHSYAFSGVVLLVENEYIVPVNKPAAEVMKFIVSGGVIAVDELNKPHNE
ncbi:MAG: putative membrane protein [Saprospiraceae bacterium]|jgi:uncharacterized membrane protein